MPAYPYEVATGRIMQGLAMAGGGNGDGGAQRPLDAATIDEKLDSLLHGQDTKFRRIEETLHLIMRRVNSLEKQIEGLPGTLDALARGNNVAPPSPTDASTTKARVQRRLDLVQKQLQDLPTRVLESTATAVPTNAIPVDRLPSGVFRMRPPRAHPTPSRGTPEVRVPDSSARVPLGVVSSTSPESTNVRTTMPSTESSFLVPSPPSKTSSSVIQMASLEDCSRPSAARAIPPSLDRRRPVVGSKPLGQERTPTTVPLKKSALEQPAVHSFLNMDGRRVPPPPAVPKDTRSIVVPRPTTQSACAIKEEVDRTTPVKRTATGAEDAPRDGVLVSALSDRPPPRHKVPLGYDFPVTTCAALWCFWFYGDEAHGTAPFRDLVDADLATARDRRRLHQATVVMTTLVDLAIQSGRVASVDDVGASDLMDFKATFESSYEELRAVHLTGGKYIKAEHAMDDGANDTYEDVWAAMQTTTTSLGQQKKTTKKMTTPPVRKKKRVPKPDSSAKRSRQPSIHLTPPMAPHMTDEAGRPIPANKDNASEDVTMVSPQLTSPSPTPPRPNVFMWAWGKATCREMWRLWFHGDVSTGQPLCRVKPGDLTFNACKVSRSNAQRYIEDVVGAAVTHGLILSANEIHDLSLDDSMALFDAIFEHMQPAWGDSNRKFLELRATTKRKLADVTDSSVVLPRI
ncbi:Aste57867_12137 [Aphanomyces stellatus]|uniref:Aste57867_12137 protein n=1 Tax=Aphanomyces stellatus TaxID=120398 RepID=A0A485KUQ8_9STRA|nr:hypothetical protein As57867_012092 [Aphanomyces stellatus]VFT88991.1 Aste57867_12137 [Aphanomyces stellatus]